MVASEENRTLTFRRWHKLLEQLLVGQGLHGGKQNEIIKYFDEADKDELLGYLELLLKEDKVQKFVYNKTIYWRATINILNEEYRNNGD
jgi:hypothetical protein